MICGSKVELSVGIKEVKLKTFGPKEL